MLFSAVCGIVISKFVRNRTISLLTAIVIGTMIGLLGAVGIFGIVYPFYVAVDSSVATIPEVRPFAVFFILSQFIVYRFQSWQIFSSAIPLDPVVVILFVATSVVGVIIGQASGLRWFSSEDE